MSPPAAILWLALRTVGAVVTVPIAEELAFRGYLMRRLVSRDFQSVAPVSLSWLSLLVSSVLFGALHESIIAGTLVGLLYGLTYRRRGSLADAVVAHGVTNALLAAYVLVTGSWGLW
jgi:CAAX prenyl protease-like protein